ncbi:hypothetical protein E2C01_091089 [Portunus trituberculatus]|uniref:Uncharacterized protein n=1 Tax=Portunus trituberculatus TaxID=210409 RepID=A0A5B7JGG4_PORTR|nr:hypothetical protein [Portunus trituberculatus]
MVVVVSDCGMEAMSHHSFPSSFPDKIRELSEPSIITLTVAVTRIPHPRQASPREVKEGRETGRERKKVNCVILGCGEVNVGTRRWANRVTIGKHLGPPLLTSTRPRIASATPVSA